MINLQEPQTVPEELHKDLLRRYLHSGGLHRPYTLRERCVLEYVHPFLFLWSIYGTGPNWPTNTLYYSISTNRNAPSPRRFRGYCVPAHHGRNLLWYSATNDQGFDINAALSHAYEYLTKVIFFLSADLKYPHRLLLVIKKSTQEEYNIYIYSVSTLHSFIMLGIDELFHKIKTPIQ